MFKRLEGFTKTGSKSRGPSNGATSNGIFFKVGIQAIDQAEDMAQDLPQVQLKLAVRWLWRTACEKRKRMSYTGEHSEGRDEGCSIVLTEL